MYNVMVHGYKPGRAAVRALNALFEYRKRKPPTHIINWGDSEFESPHDVPVINNPDAVALAVNKIDCLAALREANVPCVDVTTDINQALNWRFQGHKMYERTLAAASGGRGIRFLDIEDPINQRAKFWTKQFNAKKEFRVHVAFGDVIRVQQKKRLNGVPSSRIRNYANGYRYSTSVTTVLDEFCLSECERALDVIGLDFGAIDLLYRVSSNSFRILEINTAPAMEANTIADYYNAFSEEIF